MKRFLKHFFYLLLLLPVLIPIVLLTYCEANSEVVEQYAVLWKVTVTEADGTVYREEYDYNSGHTVATIEYYENDVLVRTEERELTENDPLLHDTFEVLPHPTATAAKTERTGDEANVTLRYFDANGNPEGYSELIYSGWDRLAQQKDFAADGTLLRTTLRECLGHTYSVTNLSGTEPETTAPAE